MIHGLESRSIDFFLIFSQAYFKEDVYMGYLSVLIEKETEDLLWNWTNTFMEYVKVVVTGYIILQQAY